MRRVGRSEAAALRCDALVVWRYPWLGAAASGAVLSVLAAQIAASSHGGWAGVACGAVIALVIVTGWRQLSIALLVDSVLVSRPVRRRLVSLSEIARIDADQELRITTDGGGRVSLWSFDGAHALSLIGVRSRGQWIADQIRAQAERGGNYAISGDDGRGLRDPWRRRDVRR